MVMVKMILMMMMMMKTVLTSLQCLGSALLPNTGVEARAEQWSLGWTCRQINLRTPVWHHLQWPRPVLRKLHFKHF